MKIGVVNMKIPELLAPAGSKECMIAAVNAGCDAVYIGGRVFGARAFAENPGDNELLEAIDFMHVRGKKLYLTVNTLLKDNEIENELFKFLNPLYLHGLDAVIVQDVGVIKYITEYMPELPIHLSTQMTINTAEAVKSICKNAAGSNITRFVPSRELNIDEIKLMRSETGLEIETFIHGALCYCYSGQCLMSSLIGGRSGNRGKCAQPCRLPYRYQYLEKTNKNGTYLLSPKDICTVELIPELIEAGIDSFKIEGRMKKPEYVAGVTEGYRQLIDIYRDKGEKYNDYIAAHSEVLDTIMAKMSDIYNRGGFSHGFYDYTAGIEALRCAKPSSMMSMERPSHYGVLVGQVNSVRGINAGIVLNERVNYQDILEIRDGSEAIYDFTLGAGADKGDTIYTNFKPGCRVTDGNMVYRTRNQNLLDAINDRCLKKMMQVPATAVLQFYSGKPIELTVKADTEMLVTAVGDVVEQAMNQPMTAEKIKEKLNKTSATPFYFEDIQINTDNNSFIPVGKLNELRRNALEKLEAAVTSTYRRKPVNKTLSKTNEEYEVSTRPRIQVLVSNAMQCKKVCAMDVPDDIYIDITDITPEELSGILDYAGKTDKHIFIAMPRILRKSGLNILEKYKNILSNSSICGYMIRNLDCVTSLNNITDKKKDSDPKIIVTDYNLYSMNRQAKAYWHQFADFLTVPLELNAEDLNELGCHDMIIPIYARVPLMVTAQCPNAVAGACLKNETGSNTINPVLIDRMDKKLPVIKHCMYCYATIHNSDVYSLAGCADDIKKLKPYAVRIDLTDEEPEKAEFIINTLSDEVLHNIKPDRSFTYMQTKGNFVRGVE